MALTPTGTYLYTANYTGGTIGGYTLASGIPAPMNAGQSTQAGTGTTCVTVEPQLGTYLYTSNALGNTTTGEQITSAGGLVPIIGSPYTASTLPTCIINVPRVTFR
jgi:hypothetical protein